MDTIIGNIISANVCVMVNPLPVCLFNLEEGTTFDENEVVVGHINGRFCVSWVRLVHPTTKPRVIV